MLIERVPGTRFPRYLTVEDDMTLDDWHMLRAGETVSVEDDVGELLLFRGSCRIVTTQTAVQEE